MKLDDQIELLKNLAGALDDIGWEGGGKICKKAAETIKLMRELIVEENNEKWHRMIDDIGDFNNEAKET